MIETGTVNFRRATTALGIGSFMVFANVYITQPILPQLQQSFGLTTLEVSGSFTVTTLMLGLSLLFYGTLSDRFGRRPLILISLVGVFLCTLLLSQVENFSQLLLLRGLQGFFLGGLPAIAIAYMGDEYSKPALAVAVGIYISANSLGGIGGRLFGGVLGGWLGWSDMFLVMAGICLICLTAVWLLLPPSRNFVQQSGGGRVIVNAIRGHLSNPLLVLIYLIGGLNFFIFVNQFSYLTFVLADEPYNLSPALLGLIFLTYLTGTTGSAFSGRLVLRYGALSCIGGGILVLICGSLLTLSDLLVVKIAGLFVNSFGFFLSHSCASGWVSRNAAFARATASSLYLVFYYFGASMGGFYLDPFWHRLGWEGIIVASVLIYLITLSLTYALSSLSSRSMINTPQTQE